MSRDAFLIFLPLGILLLSLLWWRAGRRSQDPAQWAQSLSDCVLLLRLLALLQKHRGASSAWLAGDAALGERRRGLQTEIDALWPAFAELARRVNDYAHRLPALAECLGQARALGSAAAAAGQCAPVARVRLGFLLTRAESLLAAACRADRSVEGVQAQQAVARLLEILRQDLLAASPPRVSAQTCFAVATEAIDGVFAWIDAQGGMLQERRGAQTAAQLATAI